MLKDWKDYNDGLQQFFPPSRLATLLKKWHEEFLQSGLRDLGKLGMLETASSGVYPQLNFSANLKQSLINLDPKATANLNQHVP